MNPETIFQRYQELQSYVGWTPDDARRVASLAHLLDPALSALVEDFYEEIDAIPRRARSLPAGRRRSSD